MSCYIVPDYNSKIGKLPCHFTPSSARLSVLFLPLSKINTWKTFLCLSIIIFYMAAKAEKLSLEKKFVKWIFLCIQFHAFIIIIFCLLFVNYVRFFIHSAVCLDFWFRNINLSSRRRAFLYSFN